MKVLHTSDWHLGRSLYGRKRYEEFEKFLDWLQEIINTENIDILLVAGDIFDTSTPSNRAQELYYRFLSNIAAGNCRHVVIIGGNHDSPSFLNAPKELLKALNVYVIAAMTEDIADEVIVLKDDAGNDEAIICAVPFLRDSDLRKVEAGESIEDKQLKLLEGMRKHYMAVGEIAETKQTGKIPIIGMGHLFTAGAKTQSDDGVRELYVGSLAHAGTDVFPKNFDYLALGHLHVPQKVAHSDFIRYSGSPIPIGFGEAKQTKQVLIVEFNGRKPEVREITVPRFQALQRISGNITEIISELSDLKAADSDAWLEIEYTGNEIAASLREDIENALIDSKIEIRRIINKRMIEQVLKSYRAEETLDDLDVTDVFNRCLDSHDIDQSERDGLRQSYQEIIASLHDNDALAE